MIFSKKEIKNNKKDFKKIEEKNDFFLKNWKKLENIFFEKKKIEFLFKEKP